MRTDWKSTAAIARWEFIRYLRPRQQLIGILITGLASLVGIVAGRKAVADESRIRHVAVIGDSIMPVANIDAAGLRFTRHGADQEPQLRSRVDARTLDGLLLVRSVDSVDLVVRRTAAWNGSVRSAAAAARRLIVTQRAQLSQHDLALILTPPVLHVETLAGSSAREKGERAMLIIVQLVLLVTIFAGMSYVFASITGEKQNRISEQVLSAVTAQSWIDGKIIGLVAVSVAGVLGQMIAVVASYRLATRWLGLPDFPLPSTFGSPFVVLMILAFALAGLFFWFAFLAAVAATFDDPYHSSRGPLLMLPIGFTVLPFFIRHNADSTFAQILSMLPPSSAAAMPTRLIATDMPIFEPLLALWFLIAAAMSLRVLAARVFRAGMMMYGKEPTFAEMRRWLAEK